MTMRSAPLYSLAARRPWPFFFSGSLDEASDSSCSSPSALTLSVDSDAGSEQSPRTAFLFSLVEPKRERRRRLSCKPLVSTAWLRNVIVSAIALMTS